MVAKTILSTDGITCPILPIQSLGSARRGNVAILVDLEYVLEQMRGIGRKQIWYENCSAARHSKKCVQVLINLIKSDILNKNSTQT